MKCGGCGAELQHDDPAGLGYISRSVMESRLQSGKQVLCRRCFLIKHYGSLSEDDRVVHSIDNLKEYLDLAQDVIYVIDISDFDGTCRRDILRLLKEHTVHYILNKIDLLPREVKIDEIRDWAASMLKVPKETVRPVSVLKNHGLKSLFSYLKSASEEFVSVGVTNVGKSSILNGLIQSEELTVSRFPGTTVKVASKKVGGSAFTVYDTPGIFTKDRITDLLSVEDQSRFLPRKKLSRSTIQFHDVRTVFLGGFVRLDVKNESDPVGIFHVFVPESVTVHETNSDTGNEEWDRWYGGILKPPFSESIRSNYKWKSERFRLRTGQELHIFGMGWINVAKGPLTIAVTTPEGVATKVRKGLIGAKKFKKQK